jgi:hypothetical protein
LTRPRCELPSSADGAAAGAEVGGPVGAIVGGTVGAALGAAVEIPNAVINSVPRDRSVVVREHVEVGEPLPPPTHIRKKASATGKVPQAP